MGYVIEKKRMSLAKKPFWQGEGLISVPLASDEPLPSIPFAPESTLRR